MPISWKFEPFISCIWDFQLLIIKKKPWTLAFTSRATTSCFEQLYGAPSTSISRSVHENFNLLTTASWATSCSWTNSVSDLVCLLYQALCHKSLEASRILYRVWLDLSGGVSSTFPQMSLNFTNLKSVDVKSILDKYWVLF